MVSFLNKFKQRVFVADVLLVVHEDEAAMKRFWLAFYVISESNINREVVFVAP